jgi:hypothetical protein
LRAVIAACTLYTCVAIDLLMGTETLEDEKQWLLHWVVVAGCPLCSLIAICTYCKGDLGFSLARFHVGCLCIALWYKEQDGQCRRRHNGGRFAHHCTT